MAEMMKEVVVVEPHKYEVREVEIPELANEDEVLIQMKSAGVCGSDHHIWHGSNRAPHIREFRDMRMPV